MSGEFYREKSFESRNCRYKEVDWIEYSDKEKNAVRQPRKTRIRASPPKIKKMNDEYSRKFFRWLVMNNFGVNDYHVTLTFDKEHLPVDGKGSREFSNYIKRLRRLYDKRGVLFKYIYVREGNKDGTRLHYHLILGGGVPRDDVEQRWKCGASTNCDRLQPDINEGLTALVNYLMKSQKCRGNNERSWNCSHNLKRPENVVDDNKITHRRMRKMQDAARNDEVKQLVERIYKGWRLIYSDIGQNPVTGRLYARFRLIKKE